jgi:hypothetical protein
MATVGRLACSSREPALGGVALPADGQTGVSGKLSVPLGIEVGATAERSLARHAMTFPEVFDNFAKFLALAAQTRDVLIAVDELDKLEPDDDTATRFLNDLKAAFAIANTYFLVSVSEDTMSRFERRGLPFHDVFDSTFDEILRVEPLSLAEARQLLAARVVGLPYIYAALCYVLSGGITRDLIHRPALIELCSVRQKGGKVVTARPPKATSTPTPWEATPSRWSGLLARDGSPSSPRSIGAARFDADAARGKLVASQADFADRLLERLR